jgi:cytochrome c biogenesis protein CcdA
VFWIAAGAPALIRAWRLAPWRGVAFVAGFYVTLVGSKVALAAVVAAGRHRITNSWQRRLIIAGGLLLIVGGLILVLQAA